MGITLIPFFFIHRSRISGSDLQFCSAVRQAEQNINLQLTLKLTTDISN